jgi:hypothetical protein
MPVGLFFRQAFPQVSVYLHLASRALPSRF